jgi:hypothetical protein
MFRFLPFWRAEAELGEVDPVDPSPWGHVAQSAKAI